MAQQTVAITGCSEGGIGSALAEAFAQAGYHVFATARNPANMVHLQGKMDIQLLTLDPTSAKSVKDAFKQISDHGKLDVLVNNAGQTLMAPSLDFDLEEAQQMYNINFFGAMRVTQIFAPLIIQGIMQHRSINRTI